MVEHRRLDAPDGTRLAYRLHGTPGAPWLVLTNGAGCSEEFWNTALVPTLASRFRILEWNYRGHYDSGPAPDPDHYRVEDHARDLLALLRAERIRSALCLGFSLGVQVTLEAYRREPGRFRALVLVSGSAEDPLASFGGTSAFRPLLIALLELGARLPRLTARVIRFAVGGPLAVPFAKLNRFCEADVPDAPFRAYLQKASRLHPVAYLRTLRLMGEHSAQDVLPTLAVPSLLIAGPEDTMTPLRVMERMRDAIPGAEYLVVAGGRHTLLLTRGGWIAERIAEFAARRLG